MARLGRAAVAAVLRSMLVVRCSAQRVNMLDCVAIVYHIMQRKEYEHGMEL